MAAQPGQTLSPYQPRPNSSPYTQQASGDGQADDLNEQWSAEDSGGEEDDTDPKKRKRPMSVSCETCKARKVKCDRGQPACGWCVKNKSPCEYRERKKPGLRAGYGRELEARLDRLETILQSQAHSINHLLALNGSTPQHMQASPTSAPAPEANMFANSSTMTQGGYAPAVGNAQQTTQAYNPQTPGMMAGEARAGYSGFNDGGYQETPSSTTTSDPYQRHDSTLLQRESQHYFSSDNVPPPGSNYALAGVSSSPQDQELPPYDLLYSLADLYFKHINTWCPILHRKTTFDALFGPSSLDEADRIILHAMVATTLRYSTDPRLSPDMKRGHHNVSKQKVMLYGLENSSVKSLQALVILALDLCGDSNGPPGWNLMALITRSAVQLGLSVEATSNAVSPQTPSIHTLRAMVLPEPNSWIEDESRRRLFWMIYVLDRYATITTAFEFALDDKEIDRRLPCRDDLFSQNRPSETRWFQTNPKSSRRGEKMDHMGSFSFYVEIVTVLSQIHKFLKKPVDIGRISEVEQWQSEYRDLNAALNNWKSGLPTEYGNSDRLFEPTSTNKIVNCGWVMLHATYHTTVMRLHSSAAYPARRSQLFTPSFKASQLCMNAVEAVSALCKHVKASAMLNKLGPPFAFSVWVAARLLLVHSSTVDHHLNPNVQSFIDTLREIGSYWNVADRYATLLQRVLDEFAASEDSAHADGERSSTPSSVKILADMRRNAHDLDVLMSRQPRQASTSQTAPLSIKPPAQTELDYLDVFDFFNMPRVSYDRATPITGSAVGGQSYGCSLPGQQLEQAGFEWDASSDWFTTSTG